MQARVAKARGDGSTRLDVFNNFKDLYLIPDSPVRVATSWFRWQEKDGGGTRTRKCGNESVDVIRTSVSDRIHHCTRNNGSHQCPSSSRSTTLSAVETGSPCSALGERVRPRRLRYVWFLGHNRYEARLTASQASYVKATKAELSRQYNQAFQHYIKAAELFLHLSRATGSSEKEKTKCKSNAQKALERAERIKSFTEKREKPSSTGQIPSESSPTSDVRLAPVAINDFATRKSSSSLQ